MSTAQHDRRTVLPPEDLEALLDLSTFLDHTSAPAALLGPDGQQVPIPAEVFDVLVDVAAAMRQGRAVTVAPVDQLLTTQEAADFLGISRPTLVRLLESGEIPHTRPGAGRHRRVRLQDVVEHQQRRQTSRRAELDELTAAASDAGLYATEYDYTEALRSARHERG